MKASCVVLLALALLFTVSASYAQTLVNPAEGKAFYYNVYSGKAYANSQIDTSAVFSVGGVSRLSLRTTYLDSASYITNIDYRASSSAAWVAIVADTVVATAAGVDEYVIRDNTVEKVPGVSGQIRIRKVWAASANGVTTATYSDQLFWKP